MQTQGIKTRVRVLAFALATLVIGMASLTAQTFTTLHSFDGWGADPNSGLISSGNILYGTAHGGGSSGNGTIFKVNTDGTGFTTLHSFTATSGSLSTNSDGTWPSSTLVLSGGILYGTAENGGSSGWGVIFKVNTNGTDFTTLHSFATSSTNSSGIYTNSDGVAPEAGLVLSGNTLYGTTSGGGISGCGTAFKVNTDGTGFTSLHIFTAYSGPNHTNSDGFGLRAGLILSGNTLYGATEGGGHSGYGTVFAVNTDGTGFVTLHHFHSYALDNDGENPEARLTLSGNTLYGTTFQGGSSSCGTVFAVNTDGISYTNLYNFTGGNDGGILVAGLILSGSTLYGTTMGFSDNGTVFAVNTDGKGFMTLHSFTGNDGDNPSAELFLSNNILYGTTTFGGNSGYGTVFALSLTNSTPVITSQPQNQTAQAGGNVRFTVIADANPLPNYQWQFNGQNLAGQTAATLFLTNVQFTNAGGYSVIISNAYGSVTSATAYLAVLGDGANGNTPVRITVTPGWSKPNTVTNLVFVTHGWQPGLFRPANPQWVSDMCNDIKAKSSSHWQVIPYYWVDWAWTLEPQKALNNAKAIGTQLGQQIAGMGFQEVHLIAHSAGSGMIQAIADQLKSLPNPPQIQLTFLDPYLGIFLQEQDNYGKNADWSDCYFVEDGTGGFTGSYLKHAFNADVSWVDPAHTTAPYLGLGGGEVALSYHGYPIDFYQQSIVNTDPNWCGSGGGFQLSQEMIGGFWVFNIPANYPAGSGPVLPCGPADAVQNPNPGVAGTEAGAAGAWYIISSIPSAVSSAGATIVGDAGFVLNSLWSAVPHMQSGSVQPKYGSVSTNAPAWLAMGVSVSNEINYVQFDAAFTDENVAQGLLTVYWNTNQIGMVDERVAATGVQTYRFTLPNMVSSGVYTLSFRLDSFNNSSSLAVTNVATGFVGVTQAITLDIPLVNGKPMPRLAGPAGYDYLVQTSTNLVDWTTTALLANTNGTVSFNDSMLASSSQRFYRAVMYSPIAAGQLLQVGLNPAGAVSAGAMWQVDGGAWHTNGASVPGLTAGNHTVAFNTVSGWDSPVSQAVTIYNNAVTITSGTYVQQPGSLKTTITPAGAISAGALWRVDGIASQNSGTTVNGLTVGNHAVLFSTIGGWTTPASQSAAIYANQITTTNGNYVLIADSTKPTCQITAPTAGLLVSNNNFTVTGTATDNVFLAGVQYQLNGAGWNTASTGNGWTNWTVAVSLIPMTNIIQACAVDVAGNVSVTNTISFVCILNTPLTVSTNGLGSFSPNYNGTLLAVGQTYSVTATAGTGFSFSNWTGGINLPSTILTNGSTLKFVMQSNLCLQATFRDSAKPTLTVTSPKSLSTVSTSMATVIGTANDNWSLAGVWCKSNSGTWVLATTSDNFTNWTAQVPMVGGINTIKSYAQDSAGNFSTTNSLTVTH